MASGIISLYDGNDVLLKTATYYCIKKRLMLMQEWEDLARPGDYFQIYVNRIYDSRSVYTKTSDRPDNKSAIIRPPAKYDNIKTYNYGE